LAQEASRRLRAAAALGPENIDVQAAFLAIHNEEHRSPLLDLVRRYAMYHDQKAGEEAVSYLRSSEASNAAATALECVQLIFETQSSSLTDSQDAIIAELANKSLTVRRYIAKELEASTTEFFENLYDRGDDAANCLRSVVLDQTLWVSESVRLKVEDHLFQLFLAKLMESGHDHDGRALKGIALLLIADTQRLHKFVDEDGFEALLTSLDYRLPPDVRGQATLVLSKFLEVAETTGQQYFVKFITTHVARGKPGDLILAFSAAAQFFPLASAITGQLFMTDGFLQSIMPMLEKNNTIPQVHTCFLALLNAACMDAACRQAITQHCSAWLSHKVSNGKDKHPSMAATILAKLRTAGTNKPGDLQRANKAEDDVSELVSLFTKTLSIEEGRNISDSIEGLAYTSLRPEVKETLAHDRAFLRQLLHALDTNSTIPEIVVGSLSIISNLSHYPPNLTEEQKKMTQLKAYANASKPTDPSPLEDEAHIRQRCSELVSAGIMPTLVKINKTRSTSTIHLTDQILLSLVRNPKDRGKLAQQGAVKLLVSHAQRVSSTPKPSPNSPPETLDAAHALARILISLNPAHVFATASPTITEAIPPLVSLLSSPTAAPLADSAPRDLLPTFESLLALTNLASSPDASAANLIIRTGFDTLEDLLLHSNTLLRRAATELICNLAPFPSGAAKFADGSAAAKRRMHVLLAMGDVDDLPTRRAAGGALAMLSELDAVVPSILGVERGLEIVLGLCKEDTGGALDDALLHRGLVVLANLVLNENEGGRVARERLGRMGVVEVVKGILRRTRDAECLAVGVQVVKRFVEP
jgi:protein unc-45